MLRVGFAWGTSSFGLIVSFLGFSSSESSSLEPSEESLELDSYFFFFFFFLSLTGGAVVAAGLVEDCPKLYWCVFVDVAL